MNDTDEDRTPWLLASGGSRKYDKVELLSFIAVYVSCWLLIRQDQSTGYSASSVSPYIKNQHSFIKKR